MQSFEEMQNSLQAHDAERKAQYQAVKDALAQTIAELEQVTGERDAAAAAGDVYLFTRKNAEVQIREITVKRMQNQLDQYEYPVLTADDFVQRRNELRDFTHSQLKVKYQKVQEYLAKAAKVLDEIGQIADQQGDTYILLERLTYGLNNSDSDMDANGVRYHRSVSFMHRIPDVLHTHLQTDHYGTVKRCLADMIELDQYI